MDLMTLAMAKKMGGGASSWNDLTDKPFGEEVTEGVITFDGERDDRDYIQLGDSSAMVKVSDKVLTAEDFVDATVTMMRANGETYECEILQVMDMGSTEIPEDTRLPGLLIVGLDSDMKIFSVDESFNGSVAGLPLTKGTWFEVNYETYKRTLHVYSVSCLTGEVETIKPLDAKYLPPLVSPNGTKYAITVSDDGTLSAKVTE